MCQLGISLLISVEIRAFDVCPVQQCAEIEGSQVSLSRAPRPGTTVVPHRISYSRCVKPASGIYVFLAGSDSIFSSKLSGRYNPLTTYYSLFKDHEGEVGATHFSVDSLGSKVYWTELAKETILRSDIEDAAGAETILTSERALFIHVLEETREIYWLSDEGTEKHLKKAFLDGSSPSTLSIDQTNSWVCFAMDSTKRRVYLGGSDNIMQIDVSGLTVQSRNFVNDTRTSFLYFHKSERRLFWANNLLDAVQYTDVDNPSVTNISITMITGKILSLAVIRSTIYIVGEVPPKGLTSGNLNRFDVSTVKTVYSVRKKSTGFNSGSVGITAMIFITEID
ncbi:uncharacterized protein LOC121423444 [Lytechinus variegatus]|uniref:uncharacterized protein LOC121423444 n=1 Tax=Lytechinus variegatus TaxID=7654 RepID=UPI001BB0F4C1|nr:uncharacterized protein LOC121423444 [Lytechinus variegatus]